MTPLKKWKQSKQNFQRKIIIITLKTFPATAKWVPLVPNATAVQEPANPTFKKPRAPTICEEDAAFVPKKYEFAETFSVPSFTGTRERESFPGPSGENQTRCEDRAPSKDHRTKVERTCQ